MLLSIWNSPKYFDSVSLCKNTHHYIDKCNCHARLFHSPGHRRLRRSLLSHTHKTNTHTHTPVVTRCDFLMGLGQAQLNARTYLYNPLVSSSLTDLGALHDKETDQHSFALTFRAHPHTLHTQRTRTHTGH